MALGFEGNGADDLERELRRAAMHFLRRVQGRTGGVVRFDDVAGFEFGGSRVPLLDRQRGIRKPKLLSAALSFRTVFSARRDQRPYEDDPGPDGFVRYKWRGDDPGHAENVALRNAMRRDLPLIWFHGVDTGLYLPVFPVWLIAEEPAKQQFVVALDHEELTTWAGGVSELRDLRRSYAERVVSERLHQPLFRASVLTAYANRCSLCRLAHPELLDAAHIRADSEGGEPVVANGIAMCKLHHAAFDAWMVAIRPDYRIEVRQDLLDEEDGPTLRHALQGLHGYSIEIPRARSAKPDKSLLEERYEWFRTAGRGPER